MLLPLEEWAQTFKLSLGLSYTLPTSLTYKNGKASMDMTQQLNNAFGLAVQGYMQQNPTATQAQAQAAIMAQFGQMGIDLSKGVVANYDLNVDLAFPQSIGLGVSYAANEILKLGMDIEWLNWAKAFDKMTIKLSNGNNSNINTMLGNSGAFSLDFLSSSVKITVYINNFYSSLSFQHRKLFKSLTILSISISVNPFSLAAGSNIPQTGSPQLIPHIPFLIR